MNENFYSSFVEATKNVFMLMLDINNFENCPVDSESFSGDLNISIGVTGDLVGEVVYKFSSETSLNIVKIMSGMEFEFIDEFVTSAISEIANIISGNVLTELSKGDTICDILPPVIKKPDDGEYSIRRACCLKTSVGNVCLDIRLNHAN